MQFPSRRSFIHILFLFSSPVYAGNPIVHYEPSRVKLSGSLDLQTFPGPPNYESIADGDRMERHFYLKLDQPIDVLESKEDTDQNSENEKNVQIVQLAINGEDEALWSKFRRAGKGAHVVITGELFHRLTGHHHSRVLLSVEKLNE